MTKYFCEPIHENEKWEFLRDALRDGLKAPESEFVELDANEIIKAAKQRRE